jgi:acetyl esterase/lipase
MSKTPLILLAVLAAVVGGTLFVGWQAGWFEQTPSALVQDTFAKANAGHYAEASENLPHDMRDGFRRDPARRGRAWDAITKRKSIADVRIVNESINGDSAFVTFVLRYRDGSEVKVMETATKEDGAWKHTLIGTIEAVAPQYGLPRKPKQAPPPPVARPKRQGKVENDIAYAAGGDQQKLDLYLPEKQGFATVVFIYGGGWHTGSRKAVAAIGAKLQALGFGCALPSHRLSPKDRFPAQIEDIAAAFAWVKRNIAAKGGDPGRVFLMGHSSGAHLALLLAADPNYLARHELTAAAIAGVVGLSPPVDLEPRKDGKGFGDALLKGKGAEVFSRDVAVMKTASPIQHISKGLPPVLLIVGERDFPMLEGDASAFVAKATDAGTTAYFYLASGLDHKGVVRSLLEQRSAVREHVLEFLNRSRE